MADSQISVDAKVAGYWRLTILRWLMIFRLKAPIVWLIRTGWFDPRIGIKVNNEGRGWQRVPLEIE